MRPAPLVLTVAHVLTLTACHREAPSPPAATTAALAPAVAPPVSATAAPRPAFEAPLDVAIGDLLSEYKANELRADGRWKGKLIRTHGVVAQVGKDITGGAFVALGTSTMPEIPAVQCLLADPTQPEAVAASAGAKATVQGRVSRLLGNVMVTECVVNPVARLCRGLLAATRGVECRANRETGDAEAIIFEDTPKHDAGVLASLRCEGADDKHSAAERYSFIVDGLTGKGLSVVGSPRVACYALLSSVSKPARPFPEPLRAKVAAFFEAL